MTLLLFLGIPGLSGLEHGFEEMVTAILDKLARQVYSDCAPWAAKAISMLAHTLAVLVSPIGYLVLMVPLCVAAVYCHLTGGRRKRGEEAGDARSVASVACASKS